MTEKDFEKGYIQRSGISEEYYQRNFVTLKCHCSSEVCQNWACVSNNPLSIKTHKELYGDE